MFRSRATLLLMAAVFLTAGSADAITEHMFPNDALALGKIEQQLDLAEAAKDPSGHIALAKAMLELRLAREATEAQDEARRSQHIASANAILASVDPKDVQSGSREYLLGIVALEGSLDVDRAVAHFEKARAMGLNGVDVADQLAVLYYAQNRYADVVELLSPYSGSSKDPQIHRTLAASYLALKDFDNARVSAARSVQLGAGTDVLILRASAESNLGDYDAAERTLREVLEREPRDRNAMMGLVKVLLKAGKSGPARRARDQLKKSYPKDPEVNQFLSSIGELL